MKTAASFVYGLVDPVTRLVFYVGQSRTGMERPRKHRNRGWVYEIVILEAVDDPAASVTELCPWLPSPRKPTALHEAERWWIAYGRASGWPLRNVTAGGAGTPGAKRTAATRAKISAYQKIRPPRSAETRARISAAHKGRKASAETRAKISRGKSNPSADTRARIAAAARRQFANPESRARFAEAQRKRPPASQETRAKIAAAVTGRVDSWETRERKRAASIANWPKVRDRVRAANIGRVASPEARARMSEAAKRRDPAERARIYEKNRNPSPETLARMSAASRNRSPETIEKIRQATLAQWARKRQAAQAAESTEPVRMQPDSSDGAASAALETSPPADVG